MSVLGDEAEVRRWAKQHGLSEPIATTTGNLLAALGLEGVPGMAFLADGRVRALARKGVSAADIAEQLDRWRATTP